MNNSCCCKCARRGHYDRHTCFNTRGIGIGHTIPCPADTHDPAHGHCPECPLFVRGKNGAYEEWCIFALTLGGQHEPPHRPR